MKAAYTRFPSTRGRLRRRPLIAQIVVEAVKRIKLGPVHLIDNGDGQALPRFAAAYPNAVAEVLRSLCATTGVDITALLARTGAVKEVRS